MRFHQGDKIRGSITRQRGLGEIRVGREKIFGCAVDIGEIAAASTGNEDFFANAIRVLEDGDAAPTFAGFDGTEETGGAGPED